MNPLVIPSFPQFFYLGSLLLCALYSEKGEPNHTTSPTASFTCYVLLTSIKSSMAAISSCRCTSSFSAERNALILNSMDADSGNDVNNGDNANSGDDADHDSGDETES